MTIARTTALLLAATLAFGGCAGKSDAERAGNLINQALKSHAKGDLTEAARQYREALVYDPENKFAYYNLGVIDQARGKRDKAELEYRLALESDPQFGPALFNLAVAVTDRHPGTAASLYERLIESDSRNAGAHLNLAFVLRRLGRTSDAEREFERAVALDPGLEDRIRRGEQAGTRPSTG
jgi:Tfp pilus assembly protein PilF